MKKRKIADDKYIINIKNKYYVVNEFTFNLIELYNSNKSFSEISNILKKNIGSVRRLYKKLQKQIMKKEYYEDNVNLDFPLKIQWKITNKCNLRCKHCYLGKLSQTELSEEQLFDICKKIINSNIMEVTITGGEALMVDSLPIIVKELIKNDIKVNIFTNGLLLNQFEKKLSDELGFLPVNDVQFFISLDGLEKCHDNIRGKGTFHKTLENIKGVIKKDYKVTTNTVLSKLNFKEIPKLYELLYHLNVFKIQISNIVVLGNADNDMVLSKEERKIFMEDLKNVINRMDNSKLLYAEMPDEDCKSDVYLIEKNNKSYLQKENWKCSAGIGKATIDYDGKVYCCPFMKKYALGNICDKSFSEIWSSENRVKFLKLIAKENYNSRICVAVRERNKGLKGGDI